MVDPDSTGDWTLGQKFTLVVQDFTGDVMLIANWQSGKFFISMKTTLIWLIWI
jgi:hypothetical protein